jgi:hypothetical protein
MIVESRAEVTKGCGGQCEEEELVPKEVERRDKS